MADVGEWLRDDLSEALDAVGYVGLYDAVWRVNASSPSDAPLPREAIGLARAAVEQLLEAPVAELELRWMTWPDGRVASPAVPMSIMDRDDAWVEGPSFVALVRRDFADANPAD